MRIKIFKSKGTGFVYISTVSSNTAEDFQYNRDGDYFYITRLSTDIPEVVRTKYTEFSGKDEGGNEITFASADEFESYLISIFTKDTYADKSQGDKADTAVQPNDLAQVAFSNNYDDLDNKPSTSQGLTEAQVNVIIEQELLDFSGSSVFPIWAEENSGLSDGAFEWAFGNGANTPALGGIVIPFPVELIAMTCKSGSLVGSQEIAIMVNGALRSDYSVKSISGIGSKSFTEPLVLTPTSFVNFRTITGGSASTPNTVTAWFKKL